MTDRQSKLLPLIGGFKLLKAATLFAAAYVLRHLRLADSSADVLNSWIHAIGVDPANERIHFLIAKFTGISPRSMHGLAIGTFCYATIFATEGVGLLARRRWAEYLTILSTVGFLPLEIYELIYKPHHRWLKATVLVANLAILLYIVYNLIRAHRREKAVIQMGGQPTPSHFS